MTEEEKDNTIANITTYATDQNSLQIRLNPDPLLQKIEIFLRGIRQSYIQDETGSIVISKAILGKPKANEEGVSSILNWISSSINTQTVQGNFPADNHGYSLAFEQYIYSFQLDLGDYLIINNYKFDIDDAEIQGIIDFIMNSVIPVMSRLINNEERISYGQTFKNVETTALKSKSVFPFFNK